MQDFRLLGTLSPKGKNKPTLGNEGKQNECFDTEKPWNKVCESVSGFGDIGAQCM